MHRGHRSAAVLKLLLAAAPDCAHALTASGYLPLHIAAKHGSIPALSALLPLSDAAAADSHGLTATHHAAAQGWSGALSLLLRSAPATAATRTHEGFTPLALAAMHGHLAHVAPSGARHACISE